MHTGLVFGGGASWRAEAETGPGVWRVRVVIARHTCARPTRFGLCSSTRPTAMPKLTPELLQAVPSQLNPLKERQLDLRGALRARRFL